MLDAEKKINEEEVKELVKEAVKEGEAEDKAKAKEETEKYRGEIVMAKFGPKDIKRLREATNAGMMDCKKALASSDGDFDKAIAWLERRV